MIVAMKKVAIIVQSKDGRRTMQRLRALGVIHLEHQKVLQGPDIEACHQDLELIDAALRVFAEDVFRAKGAHPVAQDVADWRKTALHVVDMAKRYEHLKEYSRHLSVKIGQWKEWGDFDPQIIRNLKSKGLYVRLYQIPHAEKKKIADGLVVETLFSVRGMAHCAVIAPEAFELPFKEWEPPKVGLSSMMQRLEEDRRVMETIVLDVHNSLCHRQCLLRKKNEIAGQLEFCEAVAGMGEAGTLAYLAGYVPFDQASHLLAVGRQAQWGILISDPGPQDRVPTFIRNPRWISIIAPLFKVIEIVPGYHEVDITLWFLIFLSVFFGMLIGDAGYGMIFLGATFWAHRKFASHMSDRGAFYLMYTFSSCAVIWGLLSGTLFGQEWLPQGFKPLVPALRNDVALQSLCFFIGALHLSLAHLWRGLMKWPSRTALADLGWAFVLWGAFFLARTLIVGAVFPGYAQWFFIVGPVFVVLFSAADRNWFKGIGVGLGNLLSNFVNSFTDVISYVRLFAVGLATVAVADSFNAMAADIGFNNVASGLIAALVLFVGHALNIVLGPMAVLVHGVRLNVLEFCNHVDVKWSGFVYRPLREMVSGG